jgi:hypothetical protein
MKISMKGIMAGVLGMGFFLTLISTGYCQSSKALEKSKGSEDVLIEEPEVYRTETMSGEVSWVGKNYISIVYDRDYDTGTESEIMVPVTEKTVFKHVKGLKELQQGDLVSIEYNKPLGKGKTNARVVTFIQRSVSDLVSKKDTVAGE